VIDGEAQRFTIGEWSHGLYGCLQAIGCKFVNDPLHEGAANRKPLQLATARQVGIRTPRTLITNVPDRARSFIAQLHEEGKRCIYKPFTGSPSRMVETRALAIEDIRDRELAVAPLIFQECIEHGIDLRVTLIGNDCFAAQVVTRFDDLIDWRLDPLAEYRAYEISPHLTAQLRDVLARLKLVTGSFDLRIDPNGEPVFFEVNPSGQFLFMQLEPGYPMAESFATLLLESDHRERAPPL
jgi:glutathione synthase/RimK-type ligase-like ATP-grasp enzyme